MLSIGNVVRGETSADFDGQTAVYVGTIVSLSLRTNFFGADCVEICTDDFGDFGNVYVDIASVRIVN